MSERIALKSNRIYDCESRSLVAGVITVEDGVITSFTRGQDKLPETGDYELYDAGDDVIAPGFIDIHSHEDQFDGSGDCIVADDMIRMGVTTCLGGNCGGLMQPLHEFIEHVDRYGISTNYLLLSGYNYKRDDQMVSIYDSCGSDERKAAAEAVKKDLELGAAGISFGLEYAPGIDVDEVAEIMELIGNPDIPIGIHIRDDKEASIPAVEEAIEISKVTGHRVYISHIGSMAAYGQMSRVYERIRKAREEGIPVYVDCYPYNAFCTNIGSAVFDEKAMSEGKFTYDQILFCTGPLAGQWCNDEIYKWAREERPDDLAIGFGMLEEEICYAYRQPETLVSTDGFNIGDEGHPRTAGSYPRVLGKYVRQEKVLSLEDALAKMTIMPAEAIGLSRKGSISPGMDADLVIFDPDTIIDKADFDKVNEPPEGIKRVMLGGKWAVIDNQIQERLGRFIPGWEM